MAAERPAGFSHGAAVWRPCKQGGMAWHPTQHGSRSAAARPAIAVCSSVSSRSAFPASPQRPCAAHDGELKQARGRRRPWRVGDLSLTLSPTVRHSRAQGSAQHSAAMRSERQVPDLQPRRCPPSHGHLGQSTCRTRLPVRGAKPQRQERCLGAPSCCSQRSTSIAAALSRCSSDPRSAQPSGARHREEKGPLRPPPAQLQQQPCAAHRPFKRRRLLSQWRSNRGAPHPFEGHEQRSCEGRRGRMLRQICALRDGACVGRRRSRWRS
jgi:hypothetical protein